MKKCSKCKQILTDDKFYIDYRRNQLWYCCKNCFNLYNREQYKIPKVKAKRVAYRKTHRKRLTQLNREYRNRNPWVTHYYLAKSRCEKKNFANYKCYGGRGIKFKMTKKDLEYLWKRDCAYLLHQPSIDRIDVNGNYVLDNCRFIELSLNSKRRTHPEICGSPL